MKRLLNLRAWAWILICPGTLHARAIFAQETPAGFPEGAKVIAEGFKFPEGPMIDRKGTLYFSDANDSKIYRLLNGKAEEFIPNSQGSNGLAADKSGNIYTCSSHKILKISPDTKQISLLIDKVDGKALNSPNDLVFDAKGNLFFTNPAGFGGKPQAGNTPVSVVRVRPDGSAKVFATEAGYPNGIEISPDGKFLYVADTAKDQGVHRYALNENGDLGAGEIIAKFAPGVPDGSAMAASGNLYVALNNGSKIMKLNADGKVLKEIVFPPNSHVSNLCFGGPDWKTIYITMGGFGKGSKIVSMPADEPGMKPYSHQ